MSSSYYDWIYSTTFISIMVEIHPYLSSVNEIFAPNWCRSIRATNDVLWYSRNGQMICLEGPNDTNSIAHPSSSWKLLFVNHYGLVQCDYNYHQIVSFNNAIMIRFEIDKSGSRQCDNAKTYQVY